MEPDGETFNVSYMTIFTRKISNLEEQHSISKSQVLIN